MTPTNVAPAEGPIHEPGATVFVWGTWAVLFAGLLTLVALYGPPLPVWDDFDVIEVAIGQKPFSLGWLWSQHNEHRVPLPRAALLGLDRLTGHDVRAGMFASAIVLAAAAALVIRAVQWLRGGLLATDAFLPIVILTPGQYVNLLWSWQLQFALGTALTLALAAAVARQHGPVLSPGRAWVTGLVLALLPLCGASGLIVVPFGVLWLVLAAWSPRARRAAPTTSRPAAVAAAAIPAILVSIAYVWDLAPSSQHPAPGSPVEVVRAGFQFLSLGFGPAAGWLWQVTGACVLGLALLGLGFLVRAAVKRPEQRLRDLGLLLVLLSCLALAAILAFGRAGSGAEAGLEPRYVTLALPLLALAYLAAAVAIRPQRGRLVQMALFLLGCVLLWPNTDLALKEAAKLRRRHRAMEYESAAHMPLSMFVRYFGPSLHPSNDFLLETLPRLRSAGIGAFAKLEDDPPTTVVELPVEPRSLQMAERRPDGSFELTGVDPYLTFRIRPPRTVYRIRIVYDSESAIPDGAPGRFVLTWRGPNRGGEGSEDENRYAYWTLPRGVDRTISVCIAEPVFEFRIQPDNRPGTFNIRKLELITLKEEPRPPAGRRGSMSRGQGSGSDASVRPGEETRTGAPAGRAGDADAGRSGAPDTP